MNKYYLVKEFDIDSLSLEISEFTSTPLPIVISKPFMGYLKGYLEHWSVVSVVIENDYIDSSFLDDYSKYYVKNFKNYKKKCVRVHFFNSIQEELKKIYSLSLNLNEIEKLKNEYLGYIVIRPIPEYFVGKVCLVRWYNDNAHCFLSAPEKNNSSLLGINFSIDTIPFMEQDHVISVCATSALWSFFNASKYINKEPLNSPFSITKEALVNNNCYDDNNLTSGYTVEMICDCIKKNGLIPLHFDVDVSNKEVLKEYIHCFLTSDYPIILGLDVYKKKLQSNPYSPKFIKNDNGKKVYDFHGLHAVVVVGDSLNSSSGSKLYIHDDMIGPYACLKENDFCWELDFEKTAAHAVSPHEPEFYVPTDIILGIHPKVRLPYKNIRLFCKFFIEDFSKSNLEKIAMKENLEYAIRVCESNKLKKYLRENNELYCNASDLIKTPLPRFVWIADFYFAKENLCFSFVFDATEVPHGKSLLYILYTSEVFFKQLIRLYEFYKNPIFNSSNHGNVYEMMDSNMHPFYIFFDEESHRKEDNDALLTRLFGIAKSPKYIRDNEYSFDEIRDQKPAEFKSFEDVKKSDFKFDISQNYYIWIIDEFGYLYIGTEDKQDPNSPNQGHPTLINGRKGRIGGELSYSQDKKKWIINSKSGRYSWNDTAEQDLNIYLGNAMRERFIPYFRTDVVDFELATIS